MLSLFCVLLVVEQPTVNANRDMTLIILNEVRICFIFILLFFWFDLVSTIVRIQVLFDQILFCHTFVTLRNADAPIGEYSRPARLTNVILNAWFHVSDAVHEVPR